MRHMPPAARAQIIDFGLSHQYKKQGDGSFDRSQPLYEMCGSKSYAAPEVLHGKVGYDGFAADMWSLGVSLFAMLSGFFPLDEATDKDWRYGKLVESQRAGKSTTAEVFRWYKRKCNHLSQEVIHLLDGLLATDPHKRLTMSQALAHPWVAASIDAKKDDQGAFNKRMFVNERMDEDGPVWRSAHVDGPAVMEDFMTDDLDGPVYRGLGGGEDTTPSVPGLARQRAFAPCFEVPA